MFTGYVQKQDFKLIKRKDGRISRYRQAALYQHFCDICKKEFWIPAGEQARDYKNKKSSYCSRNCWHQANSAQGHPRWKGKVCNRGYIQIYDKTSYWKSRYKLEHRAILEQFLGRPLRKDETVHHRNGKRSDNRIENLELRSGNHGPGATEYTKDVNRLLKENHQLSSQIEDILCSQES